MVPDVGLESSELAVYHNDHALGAQGGIVCEYLIKKDHSMEFGGSLRAKVRLDVSRLKILTL